MSQLLLGVELRVRVRVWRAHADTVHLHVHKLRASVGNHVVAIHKGHGVRGASGLDCSVGKGRAAHVGSVVHLLGALHLLGVGGSTASASWRGSALLEAWGIGSWGSAGGSVRARHVVGAKILLLASHHQPLLILLLEQHQLHLIVLQRMVATARRLPIALDGPHAGGAHVVGIVVLVQSWGVGTLGYHRGALALWTDGVCHGFVGHLVAMVLLEVSRVRGKRLCLYVWRGRDEGLELVRIQLRWVDAILKQ